MLPCRRPRCCLLLGIDDGFNLDLFIYINKSKDTETLKQLLTAEERMKPGIAKLKLNLKT